MIFHVITNDLNSTQIPAHKRAAKERGLSLNLIDASAVSFDALPVVESCDLFLRIGTSKRSVALERYLFEPSAGHIYESDTCGVYSRSDDSFYSNRRDDLPVVKTVPFLPSTPEETNSLVEYLDGFPIIVKVHGSQNGVGVMKVDSLSSLRSILDYLTTLNQEVWLKKYIPHVYQARLVVVGDKVVGSHKNLPVTGDFRTNVSAYGERQYEATEFPKDMQDIAVAAVHSLGRYYGGVDLLVTEAGEYFIAEINSPCAFALTEKVSEVDIAGPLVDFLIQRAHRD